MRGIFDYLFGELERKLEINQKYVIRRLDNLPENHTLDKKPPFENEWLVQVMSLYPDEPGIVQVKFLSSKIKNKIKNIRIQEYEFSKDI